MVRGEVEEMMVRMVRAEERRAVGRFEARKVRRRGGMRVEAETSETKRSQLSIDVTVSLPPPSPPTTFLSRCESETHDSP